MAQKPGKTTKYLLILWTLYTVPLVLFIVIMILIGKGKMGFMPDFARLENPQTNLATELIRMGVRCVVAAGWAVQDDAAALFAATRSALAQLLTSVRARWAAAAATGPLRAAPPPACSSAPTIAVLTPGIHNSAYYEHAFLADQMGVELVEGQDLKVEDGRICMRTTCGYEPIDILYRRVDDEFLDPLNFNPDSLLGVPGIFDIYRAGGITLANAPGTGISDDKALYSYMPDIIEFYTGQKPLLKNDA